MVDQYGFSPERQLKAKQYLHSRLKVSFFKVLIMVAFAFLVLHLRLSIALEQTISAYVSEDWQVMALFVLVGYAVFWLVSFPFDYYKEYVTERRFELSTETKRVWLKDKLKMVLLSGLIFLGFTTGAYLFMRSDPALWWLWTWLVAALFMVMFLYVSPVIIMPLFFKFPKLKDETIVSRLTGLAAKAGIKVLGIFEMKAGEKTKRAIAALTGIGKTRRILLSDTMLANYSLDEIEGALGHELGHHVHHHIPKLTAISIVFLLFVLYVVDRALEATVGFFGIESSVAVASLPLFALVFALCFAVFSPFMNTLSRWMEGQSDQYELDLANKPDAYISCMNKLCDQNLRYAYPHPLTEFLFYDHPSGKKRVERALRYKRKRSVKS